MHCDYWKIVDSPQGHEPKGDWIKCRICGGSMQLRISRLIAIEYPGKASLYFNGIYYKCPIHDWVAMFEIPCTAEYFKKLISKRDGQPRYLPPIEELMEDKRIAEKLESLGYF